MRKHLLLFFVLLMIGTTICAAEVEKPRTISGTTGHPQSNGSNLQIKAYRIHEEEALYCNAVITSSIISDLDRVEKGGSIVINDDYLEQYMGVTGSGNDYHMTSFSEQNDYHMTSFSEHIVFSYRIEGNGKGNYTFKLVFHPFSLAGTDAPATNQLIASAFEIGNETYHFNSTGNGSGGEGVEIKYVSGNTSASSDVRERITLDTSDATGSFVRTWNVADNTSTGDTALDWAVRGAIALDIDPTTFEKAAYGTYRSEVTVTITIP